VLKPVFAFLALSAAPVAVAQAPVAPGGEGHPAREWQLAAGDNGCMVHAGSSSGTVLSITASPARDSLIFIVQNRGWQTLSDGQSYPLDLEFDQMGAWKIDATAQAELDQDGPGLVFVVRPGREDGARFLREFAGAGNLRVGHQGEMLDSMPLGGSRTAMASMARCMGQAISQAGAATGSALPDGEVAPAFESSEVPVGI
jgi:hypothetical protein